MMKVKKQEMKDRRVKVNHIFAKAKKIYLEYPRAFWLYNAIGFIDEFGGYMLYPFFALFLTRKFGIGLSTVGLVFAVFSVTSFIGGVLGGALTDRMGRKGVIIFSLVFSSLSALGMWLAPTFETFIVVSAVVGTLANIGGPARGAVIADLLPEKKRGEGYGIVRVVGNLAVIGAPAVGGLVAAKSYAPLFFADAVISVFSAVIVFFALPETKPPSHADAKPETVRQTFSGYGRICMDIPFMGFLLVSMLLILVIMNFNTTLGVFLRDQHNIPEAGYGYLLSMNALMVVLMQFWLSRRLSKYRPMLMVAIGALLYGIGYGMYGVTSTYTMFAVAMFIITIAEMIVDPLFQSLVSSFAPEAMRGRYMAIYAISWQVAYGGGPYLAGLFLDKANPNMWWAACAALGLISMSGFVILDKVHHFPAGEATAQPAMTN